MTLDHVKNLLIESSASGASYFYFFGILMGCSFGFPMSADLLMIVAGSLASLGILKLGTLVLAAPVAILLGDTVTFNLGRKFGERLLATSFLLKVFPTEKQSQARFFLQRNAAKFIFMIRFTPGLRSLIFLTAGTMQVPPKTFYKMNILATCIYVPSLISLSFFTSQQVQSWISGMQNVSKWITLVMAVVVFYAILRVLGQRLKKVSRGSNEL